MFGDSFYGFWWITNSSAFKYLFQIPSIPHSGFFFYIFEKISKHKQKLRGIKNWKKTTCVMFFASWTRIFCFPLLYNSLYLSSNSNLYEYNNYLWYENWIIILGRPNTIKYHYIFTILLVYYYNTTLPVTIYPSIFIKANLCYHPTMVVKRGEWGRYIPPQCEIYFFLIIKVMSVLKF